MGDMIVILISIITFGIMIYLIYRSIEKSNSLAEKVSYIIMTMVIFTLIIFYYLDRYDIPTKFNLTMNTNSQNWLALLGNYAGAIIGAAIGALVAVWTTLYQIKINNEQNEVRDKENLRIQNMPIVKYEVNTERRGTGDLNELLLTNMDNSNGYVYELNIIIKNISKNSIKDLVVDFKSEVINDSIYRLTGNGVVNPLEDGGTTEINRYFSLNPNCNYKMFLIVYYQDVLSNWYKQDLTIHYSATNRFENGQNRGIVFVETKKEKKIEEKDIQKNVI